ncbi:MAG: hypothetical protein EPO27_10660 [Betaproteobacteria bacterium]|nr:MAG: hypothetical protein EPO27_10660 [Betaproteobacteria bacterium]
MNLTASDEELPSLYLQKTGAPAQSWRIYATNTTWRVRNETAGNEPLIYTAGSGLSVLDNLIIGESLIARGSNHAIGVGSVVDWVGLRINMSLVSGGVNDFALGVDCDPSITLAAGDTNYAAKMGIAGGTITTQGMSQHIGHVAALRVGDPIIVLGTGDSIGVAATVYIVDAPTEGDVNAALYVASGATILCGDLDVKGGDLTLTQSAGNAILDIVTETNSSGVVRFTTDGIIRSTILSGSAAPFRFFAGDTETEIATLASAGASRMNGGVRIGADSVNNLLDDSANGAGSATLYIGNKPILVGNGVNFGPGAVTSLTVVNGQITAIN